MTEESYHEKLKRLMDEYVHLVYRLTKKFPKEEIYGVTSQPRRAALSVVLNYIEGYARQRSKVLRNFLETSYGSLQESRYLLDFSLKEDYITEDEYHTAIAKADEIGAMPWKTTANIIS